MVDENLTWNDHIHILEKELSKNIGLLYRAKPYLDKNTMTSLYFSFFHNYLNYGNIPWASTTLPWWGGSSTNKFQPECVKEKSSTERRS